MARRGDGLYLGGRTWWLDVTVAVVLLAVLTACSRREETTRSEEDIGSRLHRECVSIVNAAMGVEGGIDLTGGNLMGSPKAGKAVLIQQCILERGGMRVTGSTR